MSWLNPGRWLLYAALVAALVLGIWRLDVSRQQIGYDRATAEQAVRDRAAEKAERDKETDWQSKIDGVANDAHKQTAELEAQLAAAVSAADRLRLAAKNLAARAKQSPGVAVASEGQPGDDPLDVLVAVLDRHSRELVEVGIYADRLRVAGVACERAYQALQPGE